MSAEHGFDAVAAHRPVHIEAVQGSHGGVCFSGMLEVRASRQMTGAFCTFLSIFVYVIFFPYVPLRMC
jgi:hypothetical protein